MQSSNSVEIEFNADHASELDFDVESGVLNNEQVFPNDVLENPRRRRKAKEPRTPGLRHVGDYMRPSKKKRSFSAGNHLHKFIRNFQADLSEYGITATSDADALDYETINSDDFVGKYLNWLAEEATYLDNPSKVLMLNTAINYASSFKEHYLKHFRGLQTPIPFQSEYWSKNLAQMTKIKSDYCHRNRLKLCEEKETATEDDLISIACICIWEGMSLFVSFCK